MSFGLQTELMRSEDGVKSLCSFTPGTKKEWIQPAKETKNEERPNRYDEMIKDDLRFYKVFTLETFDLRFFFLDPCLKNQKASFWPWLERSKFRR